MIRVLFVVLAVVAIVLAIVLEKALLYLLAVGLLIGAAGILTARIRLRHKRETQVVRPPVTGHVDDLKSLGIMDIRVKGDEASVGPEFGEAPSVDAGEAWDESDGVRESTMAESGQDGFEPVEAEPQRRDTGGIEPVIPEAKPDDETGREEELKPMSLAGNGPLFSAPAPVAVRQERASNGDAARADNGAVKTATVRKRARSPRIMVEGVSDMFDGQVMLPVLRGLLAAVDATTVSLLRQEDGPLAYEVEAVVSRNAFARNGGRFQAAEPMVAGYRALDPVVLSCGAPGGFEARRLGYYHETIAIRQVAFVPMTGPGGHGAWLLAVDSMAEAGLERPEALRVVGEFARLVHSFVSQGMPGTAHTAPTGAPLRSRREIIADEMEEARTEQSPLALALVYLNRAEAIGQDGEEHVRRTETALESRLQATASDGRVERFGELTYGVFRRAGVDDVVQWATDLQSRMAAEGGPLAGGVSVGIAMLGDRHDGPDQLRSDATDALRESFETGECIILE